MVSRETEPVGVSRSAVFDEPARLSGRRLTAQPLYKVQCHIDRERDTSTGNHASILHQLRGLGRQDCSRHSDRSTFITHAARKVVEAGGSI